MTDAYLGVDVGTGSARAGVFDGLGRSLGQDTHPIRTWRPRADFVQQSSADIWAAVCAAVKGALLAAGPDARIGGIGFDATCSLVVADPAGRPISVDPEGDAEQDVIVWMDHRATPQAERINAAGHAVLDYVGGRISPEMETPKLLWLQERMPDAMARAGYFFDLPDFLTWRATGANSRSLCSTVCKWTYLGHEGRWDESYFRQIGLAGLADEQFERIGQDVRPLGGAVGTGLSVDAAASFGLAPGTPVGVSAIDAHAGGLGVIGASLDGQAPTDTALRQRVALVGGTSSCHMAVVSEPAFVPGVWGPYYSAMIPGLWLSEGGQSATGALIDHVVQTHAATPALLQLAGQQGRSVYQVLNDRLYTLEAQRPGTLTRHLHVLPDFIGNRSPRADPAARGSIVGLRLSATLDDLAMLYLATIQGIAYGTRHIIEAMNANGYVIDTIMACGGGTKNPVFLRAHADATGCRIVLPREPEAILLGASMLGAVAAGAYGDLRAAMAGMSGAGSMVEPDLAMKPYHDAKYAVFLRLYADQHAYRETMQTVE